MKTAVISIGAVAVVAAIAIFAISSDAPRASLFLSSMEDYEQAYYDFAITQGRYFEDKIEYAFRLATFAKNYRFIMEFNAENSQSHTVEVNKFADWSDDEYKVLLGYKPLTDYSKYTKHVVSNADN
jgi:hypothetical protein